MKKKRIIARLDVKGPNVIKGIQFECLRVMGKPDELGNNYYLQGADELIYLDTVASLYQRDNLLNVVKRASENIFIPFTAGGGVRTLNDIHSLLAAGAEKVAINTAATKNPNLIREAAKTFGSQCIVVSIEAKFKGNGGWEAYTDNGRQKTGLDVVKWAQKVQNLGAGEIYLTSVDMEGTERGLDMELIKKISKAVSIPVIASGGASSPANIMDCFKNTGADAVAIASILHYKKYEILGIKKFLSKNNIPVRLISNPKRIKTNPEQKYDVSDYNKYTLKHLNSLSSESQAITLVSKNQKKRSGDIDIIDYKINNTLSVQRAFEKIGKSVSIVTTPEEIMNARALVLPGVGSFGEGMEALKKLGFIEPIKRQAARGVPLLGICLGMQMFFSESYEFGRHKGIGLIEGKVISLKPPTLVRHQDYKLPHIGWNEIRPPTNGLWKKTLLGGITNPSCVYYVHSYYPEVKNKSYVLAETEYGDQNFCAVVQKNKITGIQFHPEKSGEIGLEILKKFCEINSI